METQIIPIFGLDLVVMIESGVMIGAIIGLVGAIVIAVTIYFINNKLLQQRKKMDSAELSLKLLEYWERKKHEDFSDMVELVSECKVKEHDPKIKHYLGIWEDIAVFCNEGMIIECHRKEFFDADLRMIRNNKVVFGYLKKKHTETIYSNLWELMEKYV